MFSRKSHELAFLLFACLTCRAEEDANPAESRRAKAESARGALERLETESVSGVERERLAGRARAACSDLQLGAMDVWYGEAVVIWARLMLLEGDWKTARATLLDQAEVLQNIEKNLRANGVPISATSPVAGCRFTLGETYALERDETGELAPAIEAFKHFCNTRVKYAEGPWGDQAAELADEARAWLESRGKQVRVELGPHRDAYVASRFRVGARRLAEERYAEAVEPLETAINARPDSAESIVAAGRLGAAYLGMGDTERAWATAAYLGERFPANTNAASAVLSLGRRALDARRAPCAEAIFARYLAAFPADERRADVLAYFAWSARENNDSAAAAQWFAVLEAELRARGTTGERLEKAVYAQATPPPNAERLASFVAEFPESRWAPAAMGERANALLVSGRFEAAFETLRELGERHPEAPAAQGALAGLMIAAVEAERYDIAERVLERMAEDPAAYGPDVYVATGERLLAAERFVLAEKAFARAPTTRRAALGRAHACFGLERHAECVAVLDEARGTVGDSREAWLLRARARAAMGDHAEAIAAYDKALASRRDLAIVMERAACLADPAEKLAAYQRVVLLADYEDPANRRWIADGIVASLPLCVSLKRHEVLERNCERFETYFPDHEQVAVVRAYREEGARAWVP